MASQLVGLESGHPMDQLQPPPLMVYTRKNEQAAKVTAWNSTRLNEECLAVSSLISGMQVMEL